MHSQAVRAQSHGAQRVGRAAFVQTSAPDSDVNARRAFEGGVLGAGVMSVVGGACRWAGVPVRVESLLGLFVWPADATGVFAVGLVLHLVAGGVLGLAYCEIIECARSQAGRHSILDAWIRLPDAGLGATIGVGHGALAGVALALLPRLHPYVPEKLPAPGAFMLSIGLAGPILLLALHALFGFLACRRCRAAAEMA